MGWIVNVHQAGLRGEHCSYCKLMLAPSDPRRTLQRGIHHCVEVTTRNCVVHRPAASHKHQPRASRCLPNGSGQSTRVGFVQVLLLPDHRKGQPELVSPRIPTGDIDELPQAELPQVITDAVADTTERGVHR